MSARPVLTAFIVVCLFGNVIGTMVLWQLSLGDWIVVPAGFGGGLILGEVALLTIWGVLGSEPAAIRFPRALALIVLVLFSWLTGATVADESFPFEVSVVVSCFTIVLFVVLSGPFWVARWVSKKRIAKPLAAAEGVREQFTVRHILIWTAVVAGIVSLGKLILGSQSQRSDMPPIGILFMFARFVAIIGLLVAAVGLPMVWAVLPERPSRRAWHLILGIYCVAPLVVHELLWVIAGQTPSTDDRVSGLMAWYGFAAAALLMTGAGLMLARAHGYRLLRIRVRDSESVL